MTRRLNFILAGALIIPIGLATRKIGAAFPDVIRAYAPDTLWATLVYCVIATLFPRMTPIRVWASALLFSFAIEISQLYHAPWIDAVRRTRLGGLVLGFGFLWSDIGCYIVGCSLAFTADVLSNRKRETGDTGMKRENSRGEYNGHGP